MMRVEWASAPDSDGRMHGTIVGRGFWPNAAHVVCAYMASYQEIDAARADVIAALDEWYGWRVVRGNAVA